MRPGAVFTTAVMSTCTTPALAQWWTGAPECAHSCLSSAFSTTSSTSPVTVATSSWSPWPAQSAFCQRSSPFGGADQVEACLRAACTSAQAPLVASYTSLSSSLCSQYESCVASVGSLGSTDATVIVTRTVTFPGGGAAATWAASAAAPGGWSGGSGAGGPWWEKKRGTPQFGGGSGGGGGGGGWPNGDDDSQWTSRWPAAASAGSTTTRVLTLMGSPGEVCGRAGDAALFPGSPWFLGAGCGWNPAGGFDGWLGWGSGWSWGPTSTATHVVTATATGGEAGVTTQLVTVVMAASGDYTTTSTIGAAKETGAGVGQGGVESGATAGAAGAAARLGSWAGSAGGGAGPSEGNVVSRMTGLALVTVLLLAGML